MKKKWIIAGVALVLIIACVVGVFLATREKPLLDPKNPVHLDVWHYYSSMQMTAFDNMVEEFNQTKGAELGIFVQATSQGSVSDLFNKVLDTAHGVAGAGTLPNIFLAYSDSVYELVEMDKVVDLSAYMSQEDIAKYVEGFWQEGIINGKPYVAPIAKSTEALTLDGAAWDAYAQAAGITEPVDALFDTWEDTVNTAKAYYEYTDALTPDALADGRPMLSIDSLSNFALVSLKQLGVDFFTTADGKGVLNYDEDALWRVWDTYIGSMARGYFGNEGHFGSDGVKMDALMGYVGSTSGVGYFPTVVTGGDGSQREARMVALPVPVFEGGEKYAVQQGAGMVVTKSDEAHEYAAVEFIKWLTESERNIEFTVSASYLPVTVEAIEGDGMARKIEALRASGDVIDGNKAQVFEIATQELSDYRLYFSAPFTGRLQIRYLFDDLKTLAVEKRAEVVAAVQAGSAYEDAVEHAAGREAFDAWLAEFKEKAANILSEV